MATRLSALLLMTSISLGACATSAELAPTEQEEALAAQLQSASIVPATADERAAMENQDLLTQAAFWAEAMELNPADHEAAYKLASVVRRLGNARRASEIARQALALRPQSSELNRELGLALTASGQGGEAIEPLSAALRNAPDDWRLINALGVAFDQAGRSAQARERFTQALLLAPGEPAVLSNLGLSYALAGDPERAEDFLRRAVASGSVDSQVRQNLALVVALQGRFDEAEQIALEDVTPEMAEANMAYVRDMMSSPRRWDDLRGAEG